jgi:hypothetical protein
MTTDQDSKRAFVLLRRAARLRADVRPLDPDRDRETGGAAIRYWSAPARSTERKADRMLLLLGAFLI